MNHHRTVTLLTGILILSALCSRAVAQELGPGIFDLTSPLELTTENRVIRGSGKGVTILKVPQAGVGVTVTATSFGEFNQQNDSVSVPSGVILEGLSIVGMHSGDTGIQIVGAADSVTIRDVDVWHCTTGIMGVVPDHNNDQVRCTWRESLIDNCHIRHCDTGILLRQDKSSRKTDGINNLTFRGCIIEYPREHAVWIDGDESGGETIRGIDFDGGLIHAITQGPRRPSLVKITGLVRSVDFRVRWVGGVSQRLVEQESEGRYYPRFVNIRGQFHNAQLSP